MINIGDLLSDYLKIKNPQEDKRDVCEALREKFGLKINENQVFFRKNIIILKINPVQRSFMYIKKNEILNLVKTTVPNRFIDTVNF